MNARRLAHTLLIAASRLAKRLGTLRLELLGNQAGFTLVEVIVSIVVVSTASLALASAMSTGYLGYRVAERDMTVVRLGIDQLEFTKSAVYQAIPASYQTIPSVPAGYSITVATSAVPCRGAVPDPCNDPDLQLITVTVASPSNLQLSMEEYKANR